MTEPRFDLKEGKGTPLGKLPCFTTVKRGKATKDLENAIEPLHRIVYGRPGQSGERKLNLEDFQGFPDSMESDVQERLSSLTKDKLRALVGALGMRVLVSQTHAQVVEGVLAFLMKPKDEGKIKAETAKGAGSGRKRSRSPPSGPSRGTVARHEAMADGEEQEGQGRGGADDGARPALKKARAEAKAPPQPATVTSPSGPTEDAVRVQVYRRVLTMPPEERSALGVKQLRTELEAHFGVASGALKSCKDVIAQTASDCVKALMDAEERARATAAAQAPPPSTTETGGCMAEAAVLAATAAPVDPSRGSEGHDDAEPRVSSANHHHHAALGAVPPASSSS